MTQVPPRLVVLDLSALLMTPRNPRSDGATDLDGLAASMASEGEPLLVHPPSVEAVAPGVYRIISGERRVRAAMLAGWNTIPCLVREPLDPLAAHTIRLVENLHRRDLHPLDAATALKVAWLAENAGALGAGAQVRAALAQEAHPQQTLAALTAIAADAGFTPTRPVVTWEALLKRLGLGLDPERRKKLLRVLSLEPDVIDLVRPLALSEAALRALGTLGGDDQREVALALVEDPLLARKVRAIARLVCRAGYPVAQALAEVRGEVYSGPSNPAAVVSLPEQSEADMSPAMEGDMSVSVFTSGGDYSDAVFHLLDTAEQFAAARTRLVQVIGTTPLESLPNPWGDLVAEALALARGEGRGER